MKHPTPSYGPTRIILEVGIISTAAVVLLALGTMSAGPCLSCDGSAVLGVPLRAVYAPVAAGLAVVGLVWMLRIFRGPSDEPARWRYRDR